MQNSKFKIQKRALLFCIFNFAFLLGGCGIPNLETPECSQARDTTKQFYSWYLGTDADVRAARPEIFRKFVAATYPIEQNAYNFERDPFFLDRNWPTTFKIGACKQIDSEKVDLQLQLYWRDDARTVQKEVHVETVKSGDAWLINRVSN